MRTHSDDINKLVIHHSASPNDTSVEQIRAWHMDENGWDAIGYHYVITHHGITNYTRPIVFQGAHARGHNDRSIGICVVGNNVVEGEEWNRVQLSALHRLVNGLRVVFDQPEIYGHRDLFDGTLCPGFDVRPMFYGPNHK